jgi:hypothetical protein
MAIDRLLEELIREKAEAMLRSEDYAEQRVWASREINDVEKAFLAGAIDAMSYDVSALKNPRRLVSREDRRKLIKDILKV